MKNYWAIHCRDFVEGMENCMDSEEDHHPGRLAGPTERIPKLVHDIIHKDERDAVRGVFKLDGITGFNPGRWSGKNIPEETTTLNNFDFSELIEMLQKDREEKEQKKKEQNFFLIDKVSSGTDFTFINPLGQSKPKSTEPINFLFDSGVLMRELQKSIEERQKKEEVKRREEMLQNTVKMLKDFGKRSLFSLPKENLALNLPSYSEVYVPTVLSFEPAFCLGGSMDKEAMERKATPYGYSHPMVANAPNGYGGGPVLYTPSGGWQSV